MESNQVYQVIQENWIDEPVMALYDRQSGAKAMIAPGLGANCVAWTITRQGQELVALETPNSPAVLRERASRMGVPVLFPFPGRVRNARYSYEGSEFQLPRNDRSGIHHIHGLVLNQPWKVVDTPQSGEDGAHLTLQITSTDLPETARQGYPFEFALTLRYTLLGSSLSYNISVENRETSLALPFGFGLHPYFRAPMPVTEATPDRTGCLITIPAATHWPAEGGIPSGAAVPTPAEQDFQRWKMLGTQPFDDMYGDAVYEQGWSRAGLRTPGSGLEVCIKADENFHDWVFFTPPDRPSVAIEPYTCPPNAINFEEEGLPGGNLIKLKAGETWLARVIFEVTEF